jgi:CTP synthase
VESLRHGAAHQNSTVQIRWVNSEDIETFGAEKFLTGVQGIIVPGGFGIRGVDGKVAAVRYAREQKIPFLGLCLGMQCAVIDWARHIMGWADAHSTEFDPDSSHGVIHLLPEQQDVVNLGGTMRLGLYPCKITPNTIASQLYSDSIIYERHRHRYEFNNSYRTQFTDSGFVISGTSLDGRLVEIIELPSNLHPYLIATQFHPEFQSRPSRPHPLFRGLIEAGLKHMVQ